MTKRGNGEGSIYKRRDGRWVAAIVSGNVRRHFYAKTRQEAAERLREAFRERDENLQTASANDTVRTFFLRWLEEMRPTLRPRTWDRYGQYIRLHVVPHIGRLRLAELGPEHLQRLYLDRLRAGLSPSTVAHLHALIHLVLSQAVAWRVVSRNAAEAVRAPKLAHREMAALSPEEARRLLQAAKKEPLEALYVLAVTTGMRQGELLALKWRDVSLSDASVRVRSTLLRTNAGLALAPTKTRGSRRQVLLTQAAVRALRRHHRRQAVERLEAGPKWEALDLVFPNRYGRPLEASNLLRRSFYPLLEKGKLPQIRFHDLRHTAATLMLGRGIHPKIVAEMLGHSSVGVTLDTYSHATPTMQRGAVEAMDAIIRGGR